MEDRLNEHMLFLDKKRRDNEQEKLFLTFLVFLYESIPINRNIPDNQDKRKNIWLLQNIAVYLY